MRIEGPDWFVFKQLLCEPGEDFAKYANLFDSRPPAEKRAEFRRIRRKVLEELIEQVGSCMLAIAEDCSGSSELCVDHLIPLSSNRLQKAKGARTCRDESGRLHKARTESFGSNHQRNLILACHNCNSLKQNAFLEKAILRRILALQDQRTARTGKG